MIKYLILSALSFIILALILTSCSFSINMIHTSGTATDIVDEDQKANADVSPTINIPSPIL